MRPVHRGLVSCLVTLGLCGCATLGESEFRCPSPEGGVCMSVTEVYRATEQADVVHPPTVEPSGDSVHGNARPGDDADRTPEGRTPPTEAYAYSPTGVDTLPVSPPAQTTPWAEDPVPLRHPPAVMRIWIAPWEDQDGDLNVSGIIYTEIDGPRWTIGEQARPIDAQRLHPLQVEAPSRADDNRGRRGGGSNGRDRKD